MAGNKLDNLFAIAVAAAKDKKYVEHLKKVQQAYHDYILAEAEARRNKVDSLIRLMAKLDREIFMLKREYSRISVQLTQEAKSALTNYISVIEQKRKEIAHEKNLLKKDRQS